MERKSKPKLNIPEIFKYLASRLHKLQYELIEIELQIDELKTILYGVSSPNLQSTSEKNNKPIKFPYKFAEKLDLLEIKKSQKEAVVDAIIQDFKNFSPHMRPYIFEIYVIGNTIKDYAKELGIERCYLSNSLSEELKKSDTRKLLIAAAQDKHTARSLEGIFGPIQELLKEHSWVKLLNLHY